MAELTEHPSHAPGRHDRRYRSPLQSLANGQYLLRSFSLIARLRPRRLDLPRLTGQERLELLRDELRDETVGVKDGDQLFESEDRPKNDEDRQQPYIAEKESTEAYKRQDERPVRRADP